MGAVNSNQLKYTLSNSGRKESAEVHQGSNHGEQKRCHFGQSQNLHPTRIGEKEFGNKNSESEWQRSEDMLQRHNEENFDAWFQGNLEGNLGCQDFGRWLNLRDHEDGEEGEEVKKDKLDDEDIFPPLQVRRKLPLQFDKEFPLQVSRTLPVQVVEELPIQVRKKQSMQVSVEKGRPVQFQRKLT